ncbi:protein TFG-like isoform X2 [Biomphalaria glabrata]|uniref:Protein TFG-like isoform X2 n=1 Tax=Biomphalaria glabrata TaxID=6526 RepID=A0A9W3ANV9_BIOGL|nr:protein TFG-like isoform X2 [Biomphalaria glabrata]
MQNSGSPQFDLTGKLIIKVALGDDIRRIPIHNEDITYDELVLMMQRVYRGKLSTNDEITIKYKDEDGDLITIFDSSDLTFAIQCSRILKITLFVGSQSRAVLEPASISGIRRELQDIRDRVLDLLDRLEPTSLVGGTQSLSLSDNIASKDSHKGAPPVTRPVNAIGGKEFDPLTSQKVSEESAQNKVASSFGIEGSGPSSHYDRAATPDSVSSVGSSASNQVRAQQSSYQPAPSVPNSQHQMNYASQQNYTTGQPLPQSYAGQPGYGVPQPGISQQQPQQQPQLLQQPQLQQQPQQQQYDPSAYGQYSMNYGAAAGQPGQAPGQAQMMYGQPGSPGAAPYNQAPGMPQQPQAKGPGYPAVPTGPGATQSPNNPYSRGGYGSGYPRPSAGYPQ